MYSIVLTTVKDRREANKIARALVSERLAACVNIVPQVSSIYRWQGKVARSRELLLLIKTSTKEMDRLMARIKELHSYQVPEIISVKVQRGWPQYLKWLKESLD
ncbi:MAG: divalent-cation tolerance protein CutA [Candidatus Hadarchaeum sp.]|uniref:divalent-cation tolerance protein CutA n=1 Tax=Candidatus Hadarchaeum sp. TaxID=2883567 RepID=UPI003D0BB478